VLDLAGFAVKLVIGKFDLVVERIILMSEVIIRVVFIAGNQVQPIAFGAARIEGRQGPDEAVGSSTTVTRVLDNAYLDAQILLQHRLRGSLARCGILLHHSLLSSMQTR